MGYVGVKPSAVPLTSADITDGIITSAKIADGTIVNADINASAAIVGTKLSGINDAKAWVNFNGTGTVAIRASFNVTSITDNGTGDYTVNFTNAFADTNYIFTGNPNYGNTGARNFTLDYDPINDTKTASAQQVRVSWVNAANSRSPQDVEVIGIAFFR